MGVFETDKASEKVKKDDISDFTDITLVGYGFFARGNAYSMAT